MNQYYLRVEGVNLSAVLNDSSQLSVIRGSGLLLLYAVKFIQDSFSQLKAISTGASTGLFAFKAENDDQAHTLVQKISEEINKHPQLKHFTFVLDIQEVTDKFMEDKEAVLARNRFRQMQQLSVAVPEQNNPNHNKDDDEKGLPCGQNNLHPAYQRVTVSNQKHWVCPSIYERWQYGQDQKWRFYFQRTQLKYDFVQSFNELSDDKSQDNCHNKIAVLYFDGNGFGKHQAKCQTPEALQAFDQNIQDQRNGFLKQLLEIMANDADCQTKAWELRLETLLWGGDEIILVVPAWKGLEILNLFYDYPWQLSEKEQLTHAGGLVFCRCSTPIQRMTQLAKELADQVKVSTRGREQNLFDYVALESVDLPTESIKRFQQREFPQLYPSRTPLKPFDLDNARRLKARLSKSQVYAIARYAETENYQNQINRLQTVLGFDDNEMNKKICQPLKALFSSCDDTTWAWIHLVELWDYVGEVQ